MCEPTLLAIGGGILSAVGSIQQGQSLDETAKFNAQIARNNAVIAERKARDARLRGEREAEKSGRQKRLLIGQQRAAGAAQGVDVNTGSLVDLQADTAKFGKLDQLTARNNAEREALGFETEAIGFESQADQFKAEGKAAKQAGRIGAVGSILGGAFQASTVDPKWLQFSSPSTVSPSTTPFRGPSNFLNPRSLDPRNLRGTV